MKLIFYTLFLFTLLSCNNEIEINNRLNTTLIDTVSIIKQPKTNQNLILNCLKESIEHNDFIYLKPLLNNKTTLIVQLTKDRVQYDDLSHDRTIGSLNFVFTELNNNITYQITKSNDLFTNDISTYDIYVVIAKHGDFDLVKLAIYYNIKTNLIDVFHLH